MINGTRESKILGGGRCFRFSCFMYVTCCRLALFSTFMPCLVLDRLRVVVDVFEVFVGGC